ncbi:MAG: preprotein translocase subunit SecG [Deltaproteobacteria bacterium]|jgi:preprotein translocase subunit SecG|nr:preprotein translocase subunit SecG [Deltaproteobacteria bacterium]MBW2503853.1 preprotein translocase subunit SecG [Deltaproteobacteria bacterium]MBW2519542.1 preprotein translocase subunit SecG [Deltaproteobacteria bacterium]
MATFLLIIHICVCLALIGIVLIQGGKGAEIGAAFGAGASNTIFGASGGQSFIGKMTTGAAIIFMLTSLALAIFWGQPGANSVMPEQVSPAASVPSGMTPVTTAPAVPTEPEKEANELAKPQEEKPASESTNQ